MAIGSDTSFSALGISNIIEFSSDRTRILRRLCHRARYLRLSILLLVLPVVAGCATLRPAGCTGDAPRFDSVVYSTSGSFWFSHALVSRGYHGAGIAAEEVLSDPTSSGLVFHMAVRPAADCTVDERTWRIDRPATFRRISGRATLDREAMTVIVDCVCSVEPTDYQDPQGRFAMYR
jgi:hypothetical protein